MGKGDKKSRRGKIVLGSFGVRRPRKKSYTPSVKEVRVTIENEPKGEKVVKEIKEVKEIKKKTTAKTPGSVKEKKEVKEGLTATVSKPKKEKKS